MMLRDRIKQAVTNYLSTLPFSDKDTLRDLPLRIGVPGVSGVADYVVCDTNYFIVIVVCKVPNTKRAVLEAREHLKCILSATDTQFGIIATSTDPDSWFFSENRRNNWFVEIPRASLESRVAHWHPDMRQTASILNLREAIGKWKNLSEQQLKELRRWRWTAIGLGVGFLGVSLVFIWYILKSSAPF
ncbi:hypothetical protein F4Y59_02400 [Candidatus Poribacteria bacterium]|nr:hypothetical protein [Candidatus Poribacteria bacterium]